MKIAIIGYSASGKSTLARCIAEKYGIDALHLDTVHHLPGWQERPDEEAAQIVAHFLDTHESWVIEGNYTRLCYERRLEEADLIIEMLFNRFSAIARATKRYHTYKGRSRPDMTEGCDEKLDGAFIRWILIDSRKKGARMRYTDIRARYRDKTVVIRNQSQLEAYRREHSIPYPPSEG